MRRWFAGATFVGLAAMAACGEVLPSVDPAPTGDGGNDGPPVVDDSATGVDAPPPTCVDVDTMEDSKHCGRCNHDCLGGTCVSGKCQPVALATATKAVPWLVLDTTRVIWGTGLPELGGAGGIFTCPKAGGCPQGPTELAASFFMGALGSDGKTAYVSGAGGGTIGLFEIGQTDLLAFPELKKRALFWIVPRDGTLLLNAYYENDATTFSRTIYRASLPNGPFELVADYPASDGTNAAATVFAKDWVYLGAHNVAKIVAAPLAGGGAFTEVVIGGGNYVWSMTTDGDRVYWTNGAGSSVDSCVANGQLCQPRPDLAMGDTIVGQPRAVHFADGLLFIQTSAGELASCDPKTSCKQTVKVLARETAFADYWRLAATNIAVDADAIYYVAREGTDGSFTQVVKRVAR